MGNDVDGYVHSQKDPQRKICQKLRQTIVGKFPGVKEGMKWGVPSYGDGMFYFVGLKDHVNFGISLKILPEDKLTLLDWVGKEAGHIEIRKWGAEEKRRVDDILEAVHGKKHGK